MKITAKTTKEQLKKFLGVNAKAVKSKDKDLYDQIAYADKMAKKDDSKVTKTDLVDLVKSVMKVLGDKVIEPAFAQEMTPVENSVKKLAKGVAKKQEVVADDVEETAEVEKKAEKTAKKSLGKKKIEKKPKEGVTVLENDAENNKAVQLAKAFPKTLSVGDTTYELAEDIKSMEDLYDALGNDETIVFAYYWTKRHLKQFDYFGCWLGQPKSFDNDLDLATAIYVSDEKKVSYQVSMYTEAIYTILPKDFAEEDGVRISGGIEFQIYRAIETEETAE